MVQTLTGAQLAQLSRGLPVPAPPVVLTTPYVGPDVWVGDNLDLEPSSVTGGFPTASPLYTITAAVNSVNKGDATAYVVASGDVGGSLVVTQASSNTYGSSSKHSSTVTPVVQQKFAAAGLLGGNAGLPTSSTVLQFLNNAGQCGGSFYAYNTTSAYTGSLDANGWPTTSFGYRLSAPLGGLDGQLPGGTYACSYRTTGQTTNVTAYSGCTVSGLTNINPNTGTSDGVTRYFTLVVPFGGTPVLSFDGAIQYLNVPRDGVTETYGGPEFWATNLSFFAQQGIVRLMDLCNANCTEVSWSDRNTLRPEYSSTQPAGSNGSGQSFSWERITRFIKALLQYSGSSVKKVWICPPGLLDPTLTSSNNYAYQLPQLINTILTGISTSLIVELGDEPWNGSLGDGHIYRGELNVAEGETKCLPYYPSEVSNISSIVGNGDGTVTVTLSTASLSNIPMADGSTLTITNGMAMVCNHQQLNSTWGAGSITPAANYATNGTVSSVTVTTGGALAANQFKYTCNGTPSGTLAATSPSNKMAFFFNLTSNLISSCVSLNVYSLGSMAHVRRTFQTQQIWSTYRPQDEFIINVQQYGLTPTAGGMTTSPAEFSFARYLGGGSNAWLYGIAEAPYVKPAGLLTTGVATSGGTTITGVPWASTAIVGDQIKVAGAGASGATLTTTVAAGSSGTTLNIADTILTTVTAPQITYVYGPSTTVTASIDGTTGVMTVTAGSGLLVGMMGNGTPATLAFNTRITSQLSGTAGGVGTYQLNIPQSVSSQSIAFAQTDGLVNAMITAIPLFGQTLAEHIYTNLRWGLQPLCYEAGPDIQNFPNQQVAIYTNPYMQTLVTNLVAAWSNQGGREFCFYNWCPGVLTNQSQNWQALQSYTDISAPKHTALTSYASAVLAYANPFGAPGTCGPTGSPGSYTENVNIQYATGWQTFTTPGMVAAAGSTSDRSLEVLFCFPRGRRWAITLSGTDSVTGTLVDIYVDYTYGVSPNGTVTLPNNGAGTSNSTVPGNSTTLQLGEITHGTHRILVDLPIGRGTNVGIFSITLSKY